jgi:predicted thioesterase
LEVVEVITTEEGEVTDIIVKRDAGDIGEGDTRRIVVNQREE